MRHLSLLLLLVALGWAAPRARAQSFQFYPYDEDNSEALDSVDISYWANMSRCLCDEYAEEVLDASSATLNIRVRDTSGTYTTDEVYFYLGDDCDSESTSISDVCRELAVINHSDFNEEQTILVPINWVVDPLSGTCSEQNGGTTTLYVIMGDPNAAPSATYVISYDTAPPGVPTAVAASSGQEAINVSWEPPDTDSENIRYYDVLCAQDGSPLSSTSSAASWTTTQDVCGVSLPTDASELSTDCGSLTGGFAAGDNPNPCFVCGSVGTTSNDLRIEGLENGISYQFAVVAIDDSGNVSSVSEVVSATPVPTTDFAEHYSDSGGKEEGGFCFIATAVYGDYDHPSVRKLRAFRDQVLARSAAGRSFIRWYYSHGPDMVRLQRQLPPLAVATRLGVEGLVWISRQLTSGQRAGGSGRAAAALPLGALLLLLGVGLVRSARRCDEEEPGSNDAPGDTGRQGVVQ